MVLSGITRRRNVNIQMLLAVLVVNYIVKRHIGLVLHSVTVLEDEDGQVAFLRVRIPAVNEKLAESPRDWKHPVS